MSLIRQPKGNQLVRTAMLLALIILPLLTTTVRTYGTSFSLKHDLAYSGVPFAGGAIILADNFTNTGQPTIRVTSISFASDFWSNGTRQITSGFPFNLTAGMNKEVETPVLIPTSASIGNHKVTSTASWQYSNSSGWFNTNPVVTSITVNVSQTIESLFSSFVTILLVGLGVAAVFFVLVLFLAVRQRRKPKPGASVPASPQPNLKTLSNHGQSSNHHRAIGGPKPAISQDPLSSSRSAILGNRSGHSQQA